MSSQEDAAWGAQQLGRLRELGNFGENLTRTGVEVAGAVVGERGAVGSGVLPTAPPRVPGWN